MKSRTLHGVSYADDHAEDSEDDQEQRFGVQPAIEKKSQDAADDYRANQDERQFEREGDLLDCSALVFIWRGVRYVVR